MESNSALFGIFHNNPVNQKTVTLPEDYCFSSVQNYA